MKANLLLQLILPLAFVTLTAKGTPTDYFADNGFAKPVSTLQHPNAEYYNGVTYMARGEDGRWRASFNTRECAEAIYFLLRLVDEPFEANGETFKGVAYVALPGNDANLKWERGQVGMQFTDLADEMLASINPELVGIAPIPKSPLSTKTRVRMRLASSLVTNQI